MINVFIEASNIISPLGFSTKENMDNILMGESGIRSCTNILLSSNPFPASYIDKDDVNVKFQEIAPVEKYTFFEKLSILSIKGAINNSNISLSGSRTLFILSTTKGNIELLDDNLRKNFSIERLNLFTTAKIISKFFNISTTPIIVSNACISGVAAIILGQRLISQGLYDNIIVNGTDILSKFIISGFQSFLSLSTNPCKPFDIERDGLTLGEGSATIILSRDKSNIEIVNGSTSNDANHISGPSRTGEGLFLAINNATKSYKDIDLISAHGTATPYNDDMESIAITRTGFNSVPTNSLKGYFGHTLGAAGVIESVIGIESLKKNILIKTQGCIIPGTVENVNIILETKNHQINSLLKLASGFGGCNAAALFLKHE
jgi:3-oxoacyl-[acyl-carrier-protein] synthase I